MLEVRIIIITSAITPIAFYTFILLIFELVFYFWLVQSTNCVHSVLIASDGVLEHWSNDADFMICEYITHIYESAHMHTQTYIYADENTTAGIRRACVRQSCMH